jgi:membrane protein DedA with SNARE-associated domain/rhodanese-related sulfurtransferase
MAPKRQPVFLARMLVAPRIEHGFLACAHEILFYGPSRPEDVSMWDMSSRATDLLEHYGLIVVIVTVFTEQIGLPLPALPLLIVAGAFAAHNGALLVELLASTAAVCLLTDLIWYAAGRRYGSRIMKLLCRMSLNPDSCVSQTQLRFERWGPGVLVIAKFVPGLATIAPPLAGAMRMAVVQFATYATLGSLLWAAVGLSAGVWLGPQLERLRPHLQHVGTLLVAALAITLVLYIGYKWMQRRRFFAALRMARISVEELYQLIDAGAAPLVVDVRSVTARTLEPRRIPGALAVSLPEIHLHLKDLPRDRDIVLYCSCPNEASAARVAKTLMSHGFTRVRPLAGGLDAWIAAGYGVDAISVVTTPLHVSTATSQGLN